MSYCINPDCESRENPHELAACESCGTPLLINNRFHILHPLHLKPYDISDVFEVIDTDENETIKVMKVLKIPDQKHVELLEREAYALRRLIRTRVPKTGLNDYFVVNYSHFTHPLHCLVMEKIEGQNLEEWVEQYGKISQKLALNWLTQLLEILKYLHENHFFHRDIKPTNIIIRPDGQLVLIDFGSVREVSSTYLSKLSAGFKQEEFYEPSVTITGTAGYIPLEQVNGKVIPQSDFYALGRTIVHLVTGIHPINLLEDDKTGKLIWRNQAPHISNTFANLLEWLMEPRIFKRPLNAQTILQELSRWFHFKLKLESLSKTIYFRSTATVLVAVLGWGAYNGFLLWRVSSLADQGLRNLLKQQYSDAKSNFEEALKLKPKDTDLHYSLGQACERLGDDNCSLTQYKLAIQLNENNWEAHQSIGLFYDRNDQLSDAEKHYQKAMELEPLITDIAINNLARLKNLQPNYDDAIDLIEQGLKISTVPEIRASYYKNLGWAQFKLGDYDQAISSLQASLRLDPKFPGTYCLIVKVQKASGKPIEQETLGKCVTSEHDQPEVNQWRRELVFNRDDK